MSVRLSNRVSSCQIVRSVLFRNSSSSGAGGGPWCRYLSAPDATVTPRSTASSSGPIASGPSRLGARASGVKGVSQIAHSDCGYVAIADHAIGWLIGLGIAAAAAGLVATVIRLARG
jgi:hypothetical protein